MKKFFTTLSLVLVVGFSYAQLSGGVKAGLNSSNIKYKYDGGTEKGDPRIGTHVGFYLVYMINDKMGLQPEFVISGEGNRSSNGSAADSKTVLTYINIPLLFRYNVTEKFSLHTGPQIGFLASAKYKQSGNTTDIKDGLRGIGLAWGIGGMYELPKNFNVGLRYNIGLSDISDDGDSSDKYKVSTLQISVGYTLFRK